MQDEFQTNSFSSTTRSRKAANGDWSRSTPENMDTEGASLQNADVGQDQSAGKSFTAFGQTVNVDSVISTAKSAYDSALTRGSDLISKVDLKRGTTAIREYPVQAALCGVALGFLLGALVSRRRV